MRKLLIITAHFPPTNAVDMHRVRVSLPYYRCAGWEPSVLTFLPECVDHPRDDWLLKTLPEDVEVHRIWCPPRKWSSLVGLGAIAYRGFLSMRFAGLQLIRRLKPDLLFFSTTSFPLMSLGPTLGRRQGIPYVLDFQDPWIGPEGTIHRPSLKSWLNRTFHGWMEPSAVRHASGLMSVSDDYLSVLRQRYPDLKETPSAVIPFGYSSADSEVILRSRQSSNSIADKDDVTASIPEELKSDLLTCTTGLYAGAYVVSMEPMVIALFHAMRALFAERPQLADRFRLWFVGSHYDSRSTTSPIRSLAMQYGLESVVREIPNRVPFSDVLNLQSKSSFNVLFGSTSRGYNPSKLFQLLQCRRSVLALVQAQTLTDRLLQETGGACRVCVDVADPVAESVSGEIRSFLSEMIENAPKVPSVNEEALKAYSAEAMTERQVILFEQAITHFDSHQGRVRTPVAVDRAAV